LVYDINDLSTRRAQAVYNYLVRQKINRKRLSYKGFGTSKPIYIIPEKTPQEEDANRRVEILILEH
jgi:outer membrane protein OmpA-like peptidoglycan-associated protein